MIRAIHAETLQLLWHDFDAREEALRRVITERLAAKPAPQLDEFIVATYFFALRSWSLEHAAKEISYHATSGTKDITPGSLIEQCTGKFVGIDPWDNTGRIGLLHIAYPLKMLLQADGHLTSTDILHTVAGAIIFDVYENQNARLVALQIPEKVIRSFPGPAHGPAGVRALTNWPADAPMFGTILKPTAGITPDEVGALTQEVARCPLFCFVKEDENLYPRLPYSPVAERTRRAVESISRAQNQRGGRGIIFSPHITGAPQEMLETLHAVLDAGATGVMFSESFASGAVRMVREATKHLPQPPTIYGHNAGIGVKTRSIFREVIDLLARLDGIDFRQTAPVRPGTPFLKPYGAEWEASERVLAMPLHGIKPTIIVRAGALDQGNIGLNLADAERRGITDGVMFLAGSAINSIKDASGKPNPQLGAEAMSQAIDIHREGTLRDVSVEDHVQALTHIAEQKKLSALRESLRQRYPELK
ncbi:MAG TPA: RuBisCO large subunit C-terminal-like domain-containing protein [Candidatus Acidoferrum sp.]|nr:RuBisCO large subunit C-terminal-like domain-containing protein [Candidatus Acidoferrum sp.]